MSIRQEVVTYGQIGKASFSQTEQKYKRIKDKVTTGEVYLYNYGYSLKPKKVLELGKRFDF